MADITHGTWIKDGKPIDAVYQNGAQVYGRNLVTGTCNELKTITVSGWGNSPTYKPIGTYGAGKYYASAYVENTTPVDMKIYVRVSGSGYNVSGDSIPAGKSGIATLTLDVLDGDSLYGMWVGFAASQTESYTYKYKEMMITRALSPWSPAPEDIM